MMSRVAAVCVLGVSFAWAGMCAGQDSVGAPGAPAAHHLTLDVVVRPKSGGPVTGLQQGDFTVLDNKVARPITSFAAAGGREAPVRVILLLDAVNADYRTVGYARDQVDKFLLADGGELAHPTTLAILTDAGIAMQGSSLRDGRKLSADLKQQTVGLRTITRSTGFWGAEERLDISLQALGRLAAREESEPGRKIVVWVSPGWPMLSGPGIQLGNKQQQQIFGKVTAISAALRKARITLYSVDPLGTGENVLRSHFYENFVKGVSKPGDVQIGDLALQVLAVQSGGLALTSNNDITAMLREVMGDTKAYYEMTFDAAPNDSADEYHEVHVEVAKPGLTARTLTGYYAGR